MEEKTQANLQHIPFRLPPLANPKNDKDLDEYFSEFDKAPSNNILLLETFKHILGLLMLQLFFGGDFKSQTLSSLPIPNFITKLIVDVNQQAFDPVALTFGSRFLDKGLRAKDKEINERGKLLREFVVGVVEERVEELKGRGREGEGEGGLRKEAGDLVGELYLSDGLNEKGKSESAFNYLELVEEFCTFFMAGTDST
jgi:cytochrome P450